MKRGIAILLSAVVLAGLGYFTASKWAIRHKTITLYDPLRTDRPVDVDIAVRRDREMEEVAEMVTLPVAILNHGNTVKYTEYSFLVNVLAMRGYLVASVQHDIEADGAMVTQAGEEYVGRRPHYNKGIANILFVIDELKTLYPNADYHQLTMVGHSNGGDISMYFAKRHPDLIRKVVTLDNLRVPFITDGKFKILSFRSRDPVFKADPGVVPDDAMCRKAGITVVKTPYQHNELSDRGPDEVKNSIQSILDRFLDDNTPAGQMEAEKLRDNNTAGLLAASATPQ
ncbi:alpha/beta fold hydrolase [Bradyrhizobium sp.]|uniref:alpha/beta fold hydrolase n=1 Tax=Bradyrhizobium sp. TaxID=376 RepID=UPI002D5C0916|nr:alpha/beta fold hydrolase [Bradyrhizobium sp.]HZR72673.1 alpha/beta fold hydrolase [Bradyrhizobium sp.]